MMAFMQDKQLNEELIRQRADIETPKDIKGTDVWSTSEEAVQLTTTELKMKLS
jgi:hypothetical protein